MVQVVTEEHVAIGHVLAGVLDVGVPDVIDDGGRHQHGFRVAVVQAEELAGERFGTRPLGAGAGGLGGDAGHGLGQVHTGQALLEGLIELNRGLHI